MKTIVTVLSCFLLLGGGVLAQPTDTTTSTSTSDSLSISPKRQHSIRKATVLSAVLPGAGQVYNRKYWKVPIVLAGIGTSIYFIDDNTRNYKYFRDNLIAAQDDDPTTENTTGLSTSQLSQSMNQYRQWLDLSYISLAAVYVLNIIDANVDAHLFYFDVGEDLSLSVHPSFLPSSDIKTGFRLALNF